MDFQSTPQDKHHRQINSRGTRLSLESRKVSGNCLSRWRRPDSNLAARNGEASLIYWTGSPEIYHLAFPVTLDRQDMGVEMIYKQENR